VGGGEAAARVTSGSVVPVGAACRPGGAEAAVVAEAAGSEFASSAGWGIAVAAAASMGVRATSAASATGVVGAVDAAERGGVMEGAGEGDTDGADVPSVPAPAPVTATESDEAAGAGVAAGVCGTK
jgi:hypothetical protein